MSFALCHRKYTTRTVFPGNPLTCDCNTLWLRNWVSKSDDVVGAAAANEEKDEPRCYFPKALSGNPLRQLRTSRFTCHGRASDMIKDACTGIPLKTPVQESLHQSGESCLQQKLLQQIHLPNGTFER